MSPFESFIIIAALINSRNLGDVGDEGLTGLIWPGIQG